MHLFLYCPTTVHLWYILSDHVGMQMVKLEDTPLATYMTSKLTNPNMIDVIPTSLQQWTWCGKKGTCDALQRKEHPSRS
jgi:hypothetical protein